MHRVSWAIALTGALASIGCGGNVSPGRGSDKGISEGTFRVTIQNGQGQPNDVLQIKGGYVTSTPAGIDCGGTAHTACDVDFTIGQAVTLTSHADAGQLVLAWAGDCTGIGSTCDLAAGASPRYVVIQFGTVGDRYVHPAWTAPRVHGHEVAARSFTCSACHGQALQGSGIAPSCVGCHDATFAATAKAINESPKKDVELCSDCHANGTYAAAARHAISNVVTATATPVTVATNTADLEFTVTVKVDGTPSNVFAGNTGKTTWRGYRHQYNPARVAATVIAPYERFTLTLNGTTAGQSFTVADPVSGAYKVTIPGGVAAVGAGNAAKFLVALTTTDDPLTSLVATAVADYVPAGSTNIRDLVADQSCVNCHGLQVFREKEANGEWHHGANPYGVNACVVCHTRFGSTSRSAGGDRLTAYVHGVHNSHEMPARSITANLGTPPTPYTVVKPDAVYARNDSLRLDTSVTPAVAVISSPWSIGFPGYMVNCSACHDTQARLDRIMAMDVSFSTCMSCHDSWAGFPPFNPTSATYDAALAATHAAVTLPAAAGTAAANPCAACHDGVQAFKTVGDVHQVRITERNGLVYRGRDQSVEQGKRIDLAITGVNTGTAGKLVVTWTTRIDGNSTDPCNTNVNDGPVFMDAVANATTGQAASNMSILQAYAQGNDWVSPGTGTSPGQPPSAPTLTMVGTTATNGYTTCAGGVATSYINRGTTNITVTKGVVGLQGKPQLVFGDPTVTPPYSRVIQVRSESPVREFQTGDGSLPAAADLRREIVSNDKCLACHPGSLYQHGGNRIDSVALCVMCHDPAANERNNRDNMGVPLASTYDGKVGETYDLRTMIHAIHSAGATGFPLVYYRTNGLYFFGTKDALAKVPQWPGVGCFPVAGSTKSNSASGATSTGAQCDGSATGANVPTKKAHNFVEVHYPRHLNECGACHVNGSEYAFVSGKLAVGVTVDAGASSTDQGDDVLQGPTTTACMSCHQSGDPARQKDLRGHAYDFSWTPTAFPAPTYSPSGRAWLIQQAP